MMYISASDAKKLQSDKDFLYAPLEAKSAFAKGKLVGGLGMVQVIRYFESSVGPYDELVMCAGNLEYEIGIEGTDGINKQEKKRNLRVTRAYVSQEKTCYNGRKSELHSPVYLGQKVDEHFQIGTSQNTSQNSSSRILLMAGSRSPSSHSMQIRKAPKYHQVRRLSLRRCISQSSIRQAFQRVPAGRSTLDWI